MSIKLQILFVAFIAINVADGRPDISNATELTPLAHSEPDVINEASERQARLNDNCGWTFGCHKGFCWSNCRGGLGVLVFDGNGPEWCYTTKTFSQSYQYIPCTSKDQCGNCFKCAGPCSV